MRKKNDLSYLLLGLIIILITLVIEIKSPNNLFGFKNIQKMVRTNFNLVDISNMYNDFLNYDKRNDETVFLNYEDYEVKKYINNGALIKNNNEYVLSLTSGVVIFNGIKEGLGKTIIIQSDDGTIYTYGNLTEISKGIYNYVDQYEIIGLNNDAFYLDIYKNKYLDIGEIIRWR